MCMENHTGAAESAELYNHEFSRRVIGCAIEVHRNLGPGLLESAYQRCLAHEMSLAGLSFKAELAVPICYKGVHLDCAYRLDILSRGLPDYRGQGGRCYCRHSSGAITHLHEVERDAPRITSQL